MEWKWNYKKADWNSFADHRVWKTAPADIERRAPEELMEDLYDRFYAAAADCIPWYRFAKFFPKPWWNGELKRSKQKRERLSEIQKE